MFKPQKLVKNAKRQKGAQQRATTAAPMRVPGRPPADNQGNNVTLIRGNNPEYLTARIARDRPDILERMKAGEYKSVRAAGKDGGKRAQSCRKYRQLSWKEERNKVRIANNKASRAWVASSSREKSFRSGALMPRALYGRCEPAQWRQDAR